MSELGGKAATEALSGATPRALFTAFLAMALAGFGGVLPFARRALVDRHGWLTQEDFTETLALCQSLPGPNVVNLSIVVGARACGWRGALAALFGLIGAPFLILLALGLLYGRFGGVPLVQRAIEGVAAAAAGLVVATAARMAEPLIRTRWLLTAPVMALSFAAVGLARLPLIAVIAVLAPISVALMWRRPA
ncbi:MAG TPA: chromate transporter [Caulobacteraceae bacterium]|nr:chromate transporter [Caulobacteraceae bacterium]